MTTQISPESQAPEGSFNAVLKESSPKRKVTKYDLLPEGCYVARFKKINPQTPDEHVAAGLL